MNFQKNTHTQKRFRVLALCSHPPHFYCSCHVITCRHLHHHDYCYHPQRQKEQPPFSEPGPADRHAQRGQAWLQGCAHLPAGLELLEGGHVGCNRENSAMKNKKAYYSLLSYCLCKVSTGILKFIHENSSFCLSLSLF